MKDFGLYSLVGGIIAMLSFLKAAMSSSSMRFLSYHRGKADIEKLTTVFSSTSVLHLIIGIGIVIFLELVGVPILKNGLNIPANRVEEAQFAFHCMVLGIFFTINSVPYEGLLGSHENMFFLSLLGIGESLLRLVVAGSLPFINFDKLIYYSVSMLLVTFLVRLLSVAYCRMKYPEAQGGVAKADYSQIKEMFSFAGWNSFGALCTIARSEGISIVLNIFFGVVTNAAYGIAKQINSQLNFFSQSMLMSLRPQIMRSEGAGDRSEAIQLSFAACKFSVFLLALFSIPLFIEMPLILKVWLVEYPIETALFARLIIILSLVIQISVGLSIAMQSVGRIKYFQLVVGIFITLNVPIGYLLLSNGFPAYVIILGSIIVEIIATVLRLFFARQIVGISIKRYLTQVVLRGIVPVGCAFCVAGILHGLVFTPWLRFFIVVIASSATLLICILCVGLSKEEKDMVRTFYKVIRKKIFGDENRNLNLS